MSAHRRRPSLLGALLWIGLGTLFLLHNFGRVPDLWAIAARYWPILLILLGLGKVIDYYRHKDGVSLRIGEVVGILILLIIGSCITRIAHSPVGPLVRDWPITIGGSSVRPGQWLGTSYSYTQEATYPVTSAGPIQIENAYGLVSVSPGSDGEVRVRLKKVVYNNDESRAKSIAEEIRLEAGPQGGVETPGPVKPEAEPKAKSNPAVMTFLIKNNREALSSRTTASTRTWKSLCRKNPSWWFETRLAR